MAKIVLVNGSWTANHIKKIWKVSPNIVFPPCGTVIGEKEQDDRAALLAGVQDGNTPALIISIAQFRPEKDHFTQVLAIKKLVDDHPNIRTRVRFVMIGSTRGPSDVALKTSVAKKVRELGLSDVISLPSNVSHQEKLKYLSSASIAIHTMKNEHFGISVVEFMAAGVVPVAHKSAGPLLDIIVPAIDLSQVLFFSLLIFYC
jgi:alpha-1,2-mannosyltransferase